MRDADRAKWVGAARREMGSLTKKGTFGRPSDSSSGQYLPCAGGGAVILTISSKAPLRSSALLYLSFTLKAYYYTMDMTNNTSFSLPSSSSSSF